MIKKINLKFGVKDQTNPLEFSPSAVTIFVGPNNSGKSLLLREIEDFCVRGPNANSLVLQDLEFGLPENDAIRTILEKYKIEFSPGERQQSGRIKYGKTNSAKGFMQNAIDLNALFQWKQHPNNYQHFCGNFISLFSAKFSGKERFSLTNDVAAGNLRSYPQSNLMALFQDNQKREEVRNIIYQAFGKYFVIDPTDMGKLQIKLSDIPPPSSEVERGWDHPSVEFHKQTKHITEFSDGVQAFTGLVLAIMVGDEKSIFIDEPEAFLHPHLANFLGNKLSTLMSKREGNLIVATHSPHFLMGCIQSGKEVNIIRLTYDGKENATARLLPAEIVKQLFKNPLLRSTNTIQALFSNNVVVTEADTDRVFYNEINERMLSHSQERGISNALFINAQNKQTIWTILKPLRELGIPTAAIVDIDVLKDGGQVFTNILESANIPNGLYNTFQSLRSSLNKVFESIKANSAKCMKKDGGISLLDEDNQQVFKKFVNDFKEYGVFILENGEIERWLHNLSCTGHGPTWLIPIFTIMGDDPEQEKYIMPGNNDVWAFIDELRKWFETPDRKGIN